MKLLTLSEVAEALRVSESTARRLIKRGEIAASKIGDRGQLRVLQEDLEGYVASRRLAVVDGEPVVPSVVPTEEKR